jgi:hypothetical protein
MELLSEAVSKVQILQAVVLYRHKIWMKYLPIPIWITAGIRIPALAVCNKRNTHRPEYPRKTDDKEHQPEQITDQL